jgi:dihydroorotate dehydrogenase
MIYQRWFRPAIFHLDPEFTHNLVLRILAIAAGLPTIAAMLERQFSVRDPGLAVEVFGIQFPNPVGLAAGYDKDGLAIDGLACLGFGHIEVGTVTPLPQPGNPRPRIFRLTEDQGLINCMGFPNSGARALQDRLRKRMERRARLGINIGKGASTPLERAVEDYLSLIALFYDLADYLVINVSSPNTIGLRRLQARENLEGLLQHVRAEKTRMLEESDKPTPILIKLSPDLSPGELEDAVGVIVDQGMDGIVATNTTLERVSLVSSKRSEPGGLSGIPLQRRATEVVQEINSLTHGHLPIIAAGGIASAEDAKEKLDAGASLVQVYTGLIYQGPGLIRSILTGLQNQPAVS